MRKPFHLILLSFFLVTGSLHAQLTGTKNIPGDYATLALAITDLNTQGVGAGGVTLNLLPGNPEIAPAGGYTITASGTAADPVLIQGNTNVITASAALTAGALNDAIFKIIGGDYIGITGFIMQENPVNTVTTAASNNMTEWGVAMLYASTTNGCQFNAIAGNTISLNRTYTNTFGIYSSVRHSATSVTTTADITAASGANSYNAVYSNVISNVNYAIVFIGSATESQMDQGNDIGGNSALTGNTISNFGTAAAASSYVNLTGSNYAIFMNHQLGDNVSYNTITSSVHASTNTLGGILQNFSTTSPTGATTATLSNNTVTLSKSAASGAVIGINYQGITTANAGTTLSMNNNTVVNCAITGASSSSVLTGVTNLAAVGTLNMNGNIVRSNTSTATSGGFSGISNSGSVSGTINILNNQIGNASGGAVAYSVSTSAQIAGIINSAGTSGATLNINGNSISGFSMVAMSSSNFFGIVNSGSPGVAINMNNNTLGTASAGLISFSAASSAGMNAINNQGGTSTTALTITGNDIRGITHSVAGSSTHTYIGNSTATLSQNISSNTFTNLSVNTTGSVTFISNNVALPAGGSVTANSNSIVTGFSKTGAGGTVTLYLTSTTPSSASGTTKSEQNNNFSNITLTGATTMAGWTDLEGATGGGSTKTISNNTFSNWTCGTNAVTVIQTNYSGNNTTIFGNTISSVSGTGAITGISIGSSNGGASQSVTNNTITGLTSVTTGGAVVGITGGSSSITTLFTISGNDINTLSTVSGSSVNGITVSAGTSTNILKNKIYNLQSNNASGTVTGIAVSSGTTNTLRNNIIGDLRTPATNAANPLIGISITGGTNANVYYNTVYLNATSSGTVFGSSCISTATAVTLDMRNNLWVNGSTANTTGLTVAFRRSSTTLTSYASTSNNNCFYAGTPSAVNLVFYDGTNSDQTLLAFQTRVSTRDNASVTENPTFASTTGSSPVFLHIPAATTSLLESGGTVISGVTTDYDNDTRPGPVGSVNGGALAPDIGADEFDGFLAICNGTPSAGTSAGSPASACGSGTFTLSLTGASSGPGISYQWQSSAVSGGPYTNIPGATSAAYVASAVSSTTYYVCVVTCSNGGGSVSSAEVAATVLPLPVVSVTPGSALFCSGSSALALAASGASTYAWSPSSGLSATTGANVNASPTVTTTYTVTGTAANGCTATATTAITSAPGVTSATATATPAAVCAGNPVNLGSSASAYAVTLLSENFNGTAAGWTTVNTSTGGTPANAAWTLRPNGYSPGGFWTAALNSNDNSQFFLTNSDAQGSGGTTNTILQSPSMSTVGLTTLNLQFYNYFRYNTTPDSALVEVSTDGTSWTRVQTNVSATIGGPTAFAVSNINLNAYIGNPLFYVRFHYRGNWGYGWAIDNVTVSGTGNTFTYSWSSTPSGFSSTAQNPTGVVPASSTTYTVQITNSFGCSGTANTAVTVNPLPTVAATADTDPVCSGNISNLTGSGAATYNWMPGSLSGTTVAVTPTSTTTYTVTGVDGNGCQNTANVTVTVNPLPTVTASASAPAICAGNNSTLTASGATTYTWMPGSLSGSSVTVSPSATTTYTVTGAAASGCTNTQTVTVTVNPVPVVTASASASTICSGNSSTLTGNGASTYSWMPGSLIGTTVSVTPSSTTTYTVTGTSAAGCSNTETVTVTVNTTPTVTASSSSSTICDGSSVTLTGNGASTYTWMPGSLSGTTVSVTPSSTTTYTVTGTSAAGCTSTETVSVTVNATPVVTASASSTSICTGNTVTLDATGTADTYLWMPGSLSGASVTVTPGSTTTYTVNGTISATGCSSTSTVTVTVGTQPVVTASSSSGTICDGNSVTLTSSGAATYTWMPGSLSGSSVTVNPSVTTTYTVTGVVTAGCQNTETVTVTVNPLPTVSASASASTICSGNSSTLTGNGASTYSWMPGSLSGTTVSVTPSSTTTYTVTGTSAAGCSNTETVTVTVNPLPTVSASASASTICNGNSSTLTGNGASTYSWMPGSLSGTTVSVTPSSTTTYTVTGTSAAGCTNTETVTVTVNPLPTVTASASASTICSGNSSTLTGNGALTYSWMPGSLSGTTVSVTPSSTTTYTVTGTSAAGCSNTETVTVTVNPLPTVTASASASTICSGNSSTLTGNGASTYSWMPGSLSGTTVSVTPSSTTTYTVTGTSAAGCTNTETVTVTVNPLPAVTASAASSAICDGSSTTLTGSGASTYSWMPGSLSGTVVSVTPPSSTVYTVTGTDGNGCTGTATVSVTVSPAFTVAVTSSANVSCNGGADGSATITASGGTGTLTYAWTPSGGNAAAASGLAAATYTCTIADVIGCSTTITATITEPTAIAVVLTSQTSASCNAMADGSASVTASGGTGLLSYSWSPIGGNAATANGLSAGTYTCLVTDDNGCTTNETVTITEPAVLTAVVATTTDVSTCSGSDGAIDINVNGGTAGYMFGWSNSSITEDITGLSAGTYSCTVTDANGCTAVVAATVNDPAAPSVSLTLAIDTACQTQQAPFTLTGESPAGGIYSGPGVSGGVFDPMTASIGYNVISYTYTNAITGCSATAVDSIWVDICNGITTGPVLTNITVYPNPNIGQFTIDLGYVPAAPVRVEIVNSLGQIVQTFTMSSNQEQADLGIYEGGVYSVRITDGNNVSVKRVVKQ